MDRKLTELISLVWNRFVYKPWGFLLDYAEKDGSARIPTTEECKIGMPNPYSWLTPIPNGSFFTGLYVSALLKYREKNGDNSLDEQIKVYMEWLYRAQDISSVKGFIARGVVDDGVTHYGYSTEDQYGPWVYALWHAYNSDYSDANMKNELKTRLMRTINGVIDSGWTIPSEKSCNKAKAGELLIHSYREISLVLFTLRIAWELTHEQKYIIEYNERLSEYAPDAPIDRIDIMEAGFSPDMANVDVLRQYWITVPYHLMAIDVTELEDKPENIEKIKRGLRLNGITAIPVFDRYREFLKTEPQAFNFDWTPLNELYHPCTTVDEVRELGYACHAKWGKECPERRRESCIREAICACWVAGTCQDEKIENKAVDALKHIIDDIPWDDLCMSHVLFAAAAMMYIS